MLWLITRLDLPNCQPPLPQIVHSSEFLDATQPKGHSLGAYLASTNTIILRDSWDGNWKDRGILAHELTHHLQKHCGVEAGEAIAYQMQREYERE